MPIDEEVIDEYCPDCKYEDPEGFVETDDSVSLNGVTIKRPFIEKPINGDNHNIYIYDNNELTRLFRKEKDKSCEKIQGHFQIRKQGCYIYEEFK